MPGLMIMILFGATGFHCLFSRRSFVSKYSFRWSYHLLTALLLALLATGSSARAQDASTNMFGFTGPEIFPIDSQINQLRVADLDGDGLNDLIVVNNARAKIDLLYNQTGKTNRASLKPTRRREVNELPADSRFRIESIASEKRISSL